MPRIKTTALVFYSILAAVYVGLKYFGGQKTRLALFSTPPEPYTAYELPHLRQAVQQSLDALPHFRKLVKCPALFDPGHPSHDDAVESANNWTFALTDDEFWAPFDRAPDTCLAIRRFFPFFKKPLTKIEAEYPLAYGMLVYKDFTQLMYVLASFYQPQNSFCIAVDRSSSASFQKRVFKLAECLPNISVTRISGVSYCGFGVTHAVMSCVKILSIQAHPWKYYQYLSGVDLPLKTNYEMVQIFKALNGTFNAEVTEMDPKRFKHNPYGTPPATLWKSSLSATFSRKSADFMATSPKVEKLMRFLKKTSCSDESLWATVGGQPDYFDMPGGFDAKLFNDRIFSQLHDPSDANYFKNTTSTSSTPPTFSFPLKSYYIARYQVWDTRDELNTGLVCRGNFTNKSCVFGVQDLPNLLTRPELVAHKFYLNMHPAAFFCLYEKVRLRGLNSSLEATFSADNYANLPQVRLSRGDAVENVPFFF